MRDTVVPVPRRRRPGRAGVARDEAGVVQQIEAQSVPSGLVVVVPAQLDRPAPVVGVAARWAAVGLAAVAVAAPLSRILLDERQPAGLVVDVGQERRSLAPGAERWSPPQSRRSCRSRCGRGRSAQTPRGSRRGGSAELGRFAALPRTPPVLPTAAPLVIGSSS